MFLTLVVAATVTAQTNPPAGRGDATPQQVESLEREFSRLEVEIRETEWRLGRPLEGEIGERAQSIREEVVYLRVESRKQRERGLEGTGLSASEVSRLRGSIATLRDDLDLQEPPPLEEARPSEVELPADSVFAVRLLDPLSSDTAEVGDRIEAVTTLPVTWRGDVLIPAGSAVFGAVELVDRAGRTERTARLLLAFDRIDIQGQSHGVTATVVGASSPLETGIGREKKKLGIGAGVGGVVGAVLAGGTGAIAGALLGGSGALFATEGKEVVLPQGTMLQLRLDRPLHLPVQAR